MSHAGPNKFCPPVFRITALSLVDTARVNKIGLDAVNALQRLDQQDRSIEDSLSSPTKQHG